MLDLGEGGIGFTYLADERRTPESVELRMLSFAHNMLAQDLHGEVVYDVSAHEPNEIPGARRCGVRFDHLNDMQQQVLRDFMTCYGGRDD